MTTIIPPRMRPYLPQIKSFLKAIVAGQKTQPVDHNQRLYFADWLEDQSFYNEAHGQRWAAKNYKYPQPAISHYESQTNGGWYGDDEGRGGWAYNGKYNHHTLPMLNFETLEEAIQYHPTLITLSSDKSSLASEMLFLLKCGQMKWTEDSRPAHQRRAMTYEEEVEARTNGQRWVAGIMHISSSPLTAADFLGIPEEAV